MGYFTVPFDSFGGLSLSDAANESAGAVDVLNVEFDRPGRLRSRDGYSKVTAAAGATRYDSVFALTASAQSTTALPTSGTDDASIGTVAWTNPGDITTIGGGFAEASFTVAGGQSHYLLAKSFGFAIPVAATIVGVLAEARMNASGNGTAYAMRLVKGGVVSGDSKSDFITTIATIDQGSVSDLWGLTLTPADVNAANFGLSITSSAPGVRSGSGTRVVDVDWVRLTVYYIPAATVAVAGASADRLDVIQADGTVATTVATVSDTQSSYVAFGSPATSATYIANSGTTIRKLVGATFSTPANMPKCKFVAVQSPDNRLVAANVNQVPTGAGSTASTSLVHFSDALAPETWSPNSYVYLTPGDNEDIQGVATWRNQTLVFKSTKFFSFYGNSVDNTGQPIFNYRRIDGAGMIAPLAVAVSPAGVYFLDRRGVYYTTGGPPQRVSTPIDPLFQGGAQAQYTGGIVNPSAIAQASMCWFAERLYIGLPLGSATTNNHTLVFDPATGAWSLWDIPMGAMSASASQPARLLFTYAQGTNDIGQYGRNAYPDDAGTAISSRYRSPFVPLDWRGRNLRSGIHGVDKTVRESVLEGTGSVGYSLSNQWVQAASMPSPVTLTLGTSPAVSAARDRRAVRGRMFSFQLSSTEPWEVQTVSWNVYGYQAAGEQSEAA